MATAWAHQESAPHGSAVVADYEVRAQDRLGRPWSVPAGSTLALAMVLRPPLPAVQADGLWLVGGLAVVDVIRGPLAPWWPDTVVDAESHPVATITVDSETRGGQLAMAVLTIRIDLRRIDGPSGGAGGAPPAATAPVDALAADIVAQAQRRTDELCSGIAPRKEIAEAYSDACPLVGHRARVRLAPSGEARGTVQAIDGGGRLVLLSPSGMVERFAVDMVTEAEMWGHPGGPASIRRPPHS
jgi:BirA family biotin operon repressor/biotin-[acetyl-CoA-carboxylase] ligase